MNRPSFTLGSEVIEYATEAEVLEFANKLRAAGGAEFLSELFPSDVGNAESCLLANALNFSCSVDSDGSKLPNGSRVWCMSIWPMDEEQVRALAKAVNCEVHVINEEAFGIVLPELIGNTAQAFDDGPEDAWVANYRKEED